MKQHLKNIYLETIDKKKLGKYTVVQMMNLDDYDLSSEPDDLTLDYFNKVSEKIKIPIQNFVIEDSDASRDQFYFATKDNIYAVILNDEDGSYEFIWDNLLKRELSIPAMKKIKEIILSKFKKTKPIYYNVNKKRLEELYNKMFDTEFLGGGRGEKYYLINPNQVSKTKKNKLKNQIKARL